MSKFSNWIISKDAFPYTEGVFCLSNRCFQWQQFGGDLHNGVIYVLNIKYYTVYTSIDIKDGIICLINMDHVNHCLLYLSIFVSCFHFPG